jgi:hypothetical protein
VTAGVYFSNQKQESSNASVSPACGWAKYATIKNAFASKPRLKNRAVAGRVQTVGAIRSSETGPNRPGNGRQRTHVVL